MVQTGVITKLAGLDSGLPLAFGIVLHLIASTVIGASYGVLLRGETADVVFGSLWGYLLGLIAWYAGPFTLLPLWRTGEIDWRPAAASTLLPSLVAHLLFGVVTANIFLVLERRARHQRALDSRLGGPAGLNDAPADRPTAARAVFALGVGVLLPALLS